MSAALQVDSWPLIHLGSPLYCYLVQNTSSTWRSQLLNHKVIYSTSSWESAFIRHYSWLWWDSGKQKKDTCSYRTYMWLRKNTAYQFSSVQSLNRVQLFVTPWTATHEASLSITNSRSLPKLMSTESVMPSNHLMLCRPLLLLPSIFPSIRDLSNESAFHIRWPKYWSFSFNISPSNEHPGLISFRTDWLDLLAVQGTLKSLLQHHSLKASILRCSAFL